MTPALAATRLSRTAKSEARATTRGTKPARAQARWIISAQLVVSLGARNGSPDRALSGTGELAAVWGWPAGDGQQDGVGPQFAPLEQRVQRAGQQVVLVGHGHVGLTAQHGGQRLLGLHLGQVQPHLGRRAGQRGPGRGDEAGRGGRERGQRDPARDPVPEGGQVGFGRFQLGKQHIGMADQDHGGGGEFQASAHSFGKSHSYLPFQRGELLADGGSGVAEGGGGRGHRAVRADRVQDPETADIEHEG